MRFLFSTSSFESNVEILHSDCVPIVVARFSSFVEVFLLGSGSVAEHGCAEYAAVKTASAQSSRNVGPLADLAVRSA